MMETVDLLKQLEVNYKLISNDLEFASHKLDSRMASAARWVVQQCSTSCTLIGGSNNNDSTANT